MKKLTLFLMALCLNVLGMQAQKNLYTERLDSIISDVEFGRPSKFVFHYNAEGQLAELLYYGKWDGKWANGEQRIYAYDEKGRVTTVTTYSLDEKNVAPTRERVEYDDKGRISLWTLEMYDKEREEERDQQHVWYLLPFSEWEVQTADEVGNGI